ncbi:MAG: nitroreductase family protein [Pseudomonadota bacterium]|nr:nitroreductase family protein [Pseudomonadota bacterium]
MGVLKAIKERRSCREFVTEPISDDLIDKILEAATLAPSAANNQPWEFIVITNDEIKQRIHFESLLCKKKIFAMSGWRWVDKYKADFLLEAPVLIAVIGDPKRIGAHQFLKGTETVYQQACAAAIQNMLLAAHELGLGSLWFTLFDRYTMKKILDIDEAKEPLALICLGKAATDPLRTPRKDVKEITKYMR